MRNWRGEKLAEYKHTSSLNGVHFFPSKQRIVSIQGPTIHVWDFYGKKISTFNGHSGAIKSLGFSADENTIISGSENGEVILWRLPEMALEWLNGIKVGNKIFQDELKKQYGIQEINF